MDVPSVLLIVLCVVMLVHSTVVVVQLIRKSGGVHVGVQTDLATYEMRVVVHPDGSVSHCIECTKDDG
jgi:hypothetical protein